MLRNITIIRLIKGENQKINGGTMSMNFLDVSSLGQFTNWFTTWVRFPNRHSLMHDVVVGSYFRTFQHYIKVHLHEVPKF